MVGHEGDPRAWRVAALRLVVQDLPGRVLLGDALSVEPTADLAADIVLTDPPTDGRSEMAWLERSIEGLRDGGSAFVVTPCGLTSSGGRTGAIRRRLLETGSFHAAIDLPSGLYANSHHIPVTVWVMGKPDTAPDDVLLVDARAVGARVGGRTELHERDVSAIAGCYRAWRSGEDRTGVSPPHRVVSVDTLLRDPDVDIAPRRWVADEPPDAARHHERFESAVTRWATARQSAIADSDGSPACSDMSSLRALVKPASHASPRRTLRELIANGEITLVRGRRVDRVQEDTGTKPVVHAKDIDDDLTFEASGHVDPSAFDPSLPTTQPGDILIVPAGPTLRVAVDHTGGVVPAAPVHLLRCQRPWLDPLAVAALLSRADSNAWRRGSVSMFTDVYSLELPVLDHAECRRLSTVVSALMSERRRVRDLSDAVENLFTAVLEGVWSGAVTVDVSDEDGEGAP